jgi:hypothetical protein
MMVTQKADESAADDFLTIRQLRDRIRRAGLGGPFGDQRRD